MGELWDVLTGKEKERGDVLDARLKQLNDRKLDSGEWTRETYDTAESQRLGGRILEPTADVITAAREGAIEGLDVMASTVNDGLNKVASGVASFTWKAVPLWVWLLLAGYVAFQLGYLQKLLSRLKA